MNDYQIPVLPGWVTLTEAAEMLGVSRQHMWRTVKAGKWESAAVIGNSTVYVVSTEEVEAKLARRPAHQEDSERA